MSEVKQIVSVKFINNGIEVIRTSGETVIRPVKGSFNTTEYTYINKGKKVKVDDLVIVHAKEGMEVARVSNVSVPLPNIPSTYKEILGFASVPVLDNHLKEIKKEKITAKIKKAYQKKMEEKAIGEMAAEFPELKAMLEELNALED